ncbi:sigma-70 family RNA polymerase sigma factor [Methylorubrum extorquens]
MPEVIFNSNRRTLEEIFRAHNGWLKNWLRKQSWTVQSAEDLASDVFCALLTVPNIGAIRQPRAMMTTIARRLIYDECRRHDLHAAYKAELTFLPEVLEVSAEDRLILIQALQAVETILANLPRKARIAFLMSQIEGIPYAVIAVELNVSVSMVRKYVAQGLRAAYAAVDHQN